jgi:TonB family protein
MNSATLTVGKTKWLAPGAIAIIASLAWVLPTTSALAQDSPPRIDTAVDYQPPYPDSAQAGGEQGKVVLRVEVTATGAVHGVRVAQSSGFTDLDNAAVAGVLGWRFIPAVHNGDTASGVTNVGIVFQLPTAVAPARPKGS